MKITGIVAIYLPPTTHQMLHLCPRTIKKAPSLPLCMEELGALGGYLTNIVSEPELELRSQNSEVSDSAYELLSYQLYW